MMECCFNCKHFEDYIPWYDLDGDDPVDEIYCDIYAHGDYDYKTNTCEKYEEKKND